MSYRNTQFVAGPGMAIDQSNPDSPEFTSNGISPDSSISSLASTTGALPAVTYANGTAGVGATLTRNANNALPQQDGVTLMAGDLLLVQNQSAQLQNGLYVLTVVGSAGAPFVLTRSSDADETDELNSLVVIPAQGLTQKGIAFGQQTADPIIGNDPIVFSPSANLAVTQAPAGTQTKFQIPVWTGIPRQLLKGTSNFTYNTKFKNLVTDSATHTVLIGTGVAAASSGISYAVSIGNGAGNAATTLNNSVFVGNLSGSTSSDNDHAVFIGDSSGSLSGSNANSVFIGTGAGASATNMSDSVFIGHNAGSGDSGGTPSIVIGPSTNSSTFDNTIVLGVGTATAATANGQMTVDPLITQLNMRGVNMTMPTANVSGLLTNNGSGTLTWAPLAFSSLTGTPTTLAGYGITDGQKSAVSGDLLGQTGAVATVATATSPNDGSKHTYSLGAYLNITAVTLDVVQEQVTYTDENGTSQTTNFFPSGLTSAGIGTVGNFSMQTMNIRVNPNTVITIKTILTTGTGSIAYDVGGTIQLLK